MRRTFIEVAASLGVSMFIAVAVMAVGRVISTAPAPPPAHVTAQAGCWDARLLGLNGSGVTGRARLCVVDEGVRPAVDAEGLTPEIAYSVWLAYFNRPQECHGMRCTIEDLRGDSAVGVASRMDGIVANGMRKAQFYGDFRDLRLTGGSEVSLLVFERGHVSTGDTRGRARQLLTLQFPGLDVPAAGTDVFGERLVAQAIFAFP